MTQYKEAKQQKAAASKIDTKDPLSKLNNDLDLGENDFLKPNRASAR